MIYIFEFHNFISDFYLKVASEHWKSWLFTVSFINFSNPLSVHQLISSWPHPDIKTMHSSNKEISQKHHWERGKQLLPIKNHIVRAKFVRRSNLLSLSLHIVNIKFLFAKKINCFSAINKYDTEFGFY